MPGDLDRRKSPVQERGICGDKKHQAGAVMGRNKRALIIRGSLAIFFTLVAAVNEAQTQRQPSLRSGTWYEFLLKRCNPTGFDYGAWLERRRETFLQDTVRSPAFWYSLSVTLWSLLLTASCLKLLLDNRRRMRITAEMLADIYSHDVYSRQMAKEAIERHNRHMEQCNRVAEAEGGGTRPGWGDTRTDRLKEELQRVASELEATAQERNKLQEELRQKALIVVDLSTRLDALSKKQNDARESACAGAESDAGTAKFIGPINRLQEELYAERQKNKRLKGA
jgi:sarcosine oxidase delta subunit